MFHIWLDQFQDMRGMHRHAGFWNDVKRYETSTIDFVLPCHRLPVAWVSAGNSAGKTSEPRATEFPGSGTKSGDVSRRSYNALLSQLSIQCLYFSPPARWGLLDFMSVASSCLVLLLLLSSSRPPRPPRHPCRPCRPRRPRRRRRPRRPRPTATRDPQCSLPDLNHDHPRPVFPAGPQPRPATPSVPCRTSTTTSHAQCSLPDLNHDHPRPVFPAGPHVGRYGTKNVQKKVRKNVRKNVRRYAR